MIKSTIIIRSKLSFVFLLSAGIAAAQLPGKFAGQGPIKAVPTESRPIQKQWKGIFSFPGSDVFFSNEFDGARLNGVARINDSLFSVLVSPENIPVNASPWYSFKLWAKTPRTIVIRLAYQQAKHRYAPRISRNGRDWSLTGEFAGDKRDTSLNEYSFQVSIGKDTTWVSAQELLTSAETSQWAAQFIKRSGGQQLTIGSSHLGKKMTLLKAGNLSAKNRILIIGRQHPPEVTGQIAQQAFVERIIADDPLAKQFLQKFQLYVVPLMNPDGVDGGHWRHNAGGVDLNRDWFAFNQPETRAVRDFLEKEMKDSSARLWFALDFHSTHDDIFYIVDPRLQGLIPGFQQEWLQGFTRAIPGYIPNIKPLYSEGPTYTSFSYLFKTYGTEALVYEIGDNTSREFILKKSGVGAESLMKLLLEKVK